MMFRYQVIDTEDGSVFGSVYVRNLKDVEKRDITAYEKAAKKLSRMGYGPATFYTMAVIPIGVHK